jgi:hypothetical protein
MLLGRTLALISLPLLLTLFCGCHTISPEIQRMKWQWVDPASAQKAIRCRDQVVPLSAQTLDPRKPVLLLLHGATDDPSEMLDIFEEWKEKYNVLLYSFDFSLPVKTVGADLVKELAALKKENSFVTNLVVIDYSYSAIVFRAAVLSADDTLFSGTEVIQLVPTAAGSFLARRMKYHWAGALVSFLSNVGAAQNPYGRITRELWGPEGTRKYNQRIKSTKSILLEDDRHSLANIDDAQIRQMYSDGIGDVVAVVPKSAGVPHDYFTTSPIGLSYLRQILEPILIAKGNFRKEATSP